MGARIRCNGTEKLRGRHHDRSEGYEKVGLKGIVEVG
jgi:hypothetical protein